MRDIFAAVLHLERVGRDDNFFALGDAYCGAWHLYDLLEAGAAGWQPRFAYGA